MPFRMMVGGRVGSGQQWMSWISIEDLVRMILWMLQTPSVSGHFNAVSPEPVQKHRLYKSIGLGLAQTHPRTCARSGIASTLWRDG